jgi:hypothetical protein
VDTTAADLSSYCQSACARAAECSEPNTDTGGSVAKVTGSIPNDAEVERCAEACVSDLPHTRTARYLLASASECLARKDCKALQDCLEAVAQNDDEWHP